HRFERDSGNVSCSFSGRTGGHADICFWAAAVGDVLPARFLRSPCTDHWRYFKIDALSKGILMGKSSISNNIRKLRFFHNEMTQQQLAEKVGVTRQTIIAMEQDKYSPSLELAFRIARIFETPLEEVFSYH